MESTILNGSDTATLSFWIKPSTNVPDLPLISVVNEQQEMMKLDQPDGPGRRNFAGNGAADES